MRNADLIRVALKCANNIIYYFTRNNIKRTRDYLQLHYANINKYPQKHSE